MLEVRGLQKSYDRKKNVLNDVSFTVPLNQLTCLIGLNGEGKSTILKAIIGLIPVDVGTITIDGEKKQDCITFVPDLSTMPSYMSVGEAIAYMRDYYPDWNPQVADELMGFFKLVPTDRIANLSKGNKAKVNLLIGFAMNRPYLLLDEPLAGIDLFTKEQIAWIFSSHYMEGKGILITTHEIAEVEHLIDRVIFLQNGTILQEEDSEEMRELYGKSVQDRMREVYQT